MKHVLLFFVLLIISLSCSKPAADKGIRYFVITQPETETQNYIKSSITSYSIMIKEDRYNYKNFLERGKLYYELSDASGNLFYEKRGLDDLNEAIRLNPKAAIVYKLRAEKLCKMGNKKGAFNDLDIYLKFKPNDIASKKKWLSLLYLEHDSTFISKENAKFKKIKKNNLKKIEKFYNTKFPRSIEEAVKFLLFLLSNNTKHVIKLTAVNELYKYHFSLGMYIRNEFGLWMGNYELLKSCGSEDMHPDDASAVIIENLWFRLQSENNLK